MRTATEEFLTGRKVTVQGHTYRDKDGNVQSDIYLVVGPHPWIAGVMRIQDVIDGDFTAAPTESITPI